MSIGLVLLAQQASAQSGCVIVSAELDRYFRAIGTDEATKTADELSVLDIPVVLQTYADTARDAAKALDRKRVYTAEQVAVLDNLTGFVDCFVGDESVPVWIDGVSMPFAERFSQQSRLDLLEAVYAGNGEAPVIGCIRGGQC
ncbi:hypothetical protein [Jannaschia pohangensis]|nr:hypothetical protein [Jannaschia pohangensis]